MKRLKTIFLSIGSILILGSMVCILAQFSRADTVVFSALPFTLAGVMLVFVSTMIGIHIAPQKKRSYRERYFERKQQHC